MGVWWIAVGRNSVLLLGRAVFFWWVRSLGLLMLLHLVLKFLARIPFCQAQLEGALARPLGGTERIHSSSPSMPEDFKDHRPVQTQATRIRIFKIMRSQLRAIFAAVVEVAVNVLFKIGFMVQTVALLLTAGRGEASYNAHLRSSKFLLRPENRPVDPEIITARHIIFIRHGESFWNMVVNRRPLWRVGFRAAGLILLEAFLGCEADSAIVDSPLSWQGRQQASDLGIFWKAFLSRNYETTTGGSPVRNQKFWAASSDDTRTPRSFANTIVDVALQGSVVPAGAGGVTARAGGAAIPGATLATTRLSQAALTSIASGNFAVATSGLRRAISTSLIALEPLLAHWEAERDLYSESTEESLETLRNRRHGKIYALRSLQEVTRNADGVSLTNFHDGLRVLTPSCESMFGPWFGKLDLESRSRNRVDFSDLVTTTLADTKKAAAGGVLGRAYLFARKLFTPPQLFDRMNSFASWACSSDLTAISDPTKPVQALIVVGHSIWLRKFLTLFLPPLSTHAFKHQKLPNCSMLHFELIEYRVKHPRVEGVSSGVDYWIDPNSVQVIT